MKILIVSEKGIDLTAAKKVFVNNGMSVVSVEDEIFESIDDNLDISEYAAMVYWGKNAENVKKAFTYARLCKFKKAVYVSSIYSYFDRTYPDRNLKKHPYVKDAELCEEMALAFCDYIDVSVVELPLISGELPPDFPTVNGEVGFKLKKLYFAPSGGSASIDRDSAALAVLAVLLNGKNGVIYPIGGECKKYKEFLLDNLGGDAKVYEFPEELAGVAALSKKMRLKKANYQPLFDIKKLYTEDLVRNYYLDSSPVKEILEYDKLLGGYKENK